MATYTNDLRLKEITTGDEDGLWGTSTNTNLSLIADAFGYGTKSVAADADETFTMPDATADGTRALYLKITSGVSLTATRTITLAPNTVSKVWLIENATSGSQSITIKQGSGATVTIATGAKALVYTDGAGAGGAVVLANPTAAVVNLATGVTGTLPVANGGTGITALGTGVATALGQNVTGSGSIVLSTSPTLVTPALGTPTSGSLTNCTADGTNAVGFRTIPQNSQSAAYELVLADSGKHILHPSADTSARTFTIPANGSVAFPIGTAVTFVNQASGGVITIAITTDTMRLAGAGTTGSRTLAANGVATAIKLTSTEWIISGTGLT
jgi:hypothetical protein